MLAQAGMLVLLEGERKQERISNLKFQISNAERA
jgi:hypothetical protein